MKNILFFDFIGLLVFFVTFLVTMIYIYVKTSMLFDSFSAAVMNGLLFWITYITVKMCYIASKKNK